MGICFSIHNKYSKLINPPMRGELVFCDNEMGHTYVYMDDIPEGFANVEIYENVYEID